MGGEERNQTNERTLMKMLISARERLGAHKTPLIIPSKYPGFHISFCPYMTFTFIRVVVNCK